MFNMTRDINGYNAFGLPPADYKYSGKLIASLEQTVTVPSGYSKWAVLFAIEGSDSIWVAYNQTAEFPIGIMASTSSEHNPTLRYLKGGDVIHIITSDSASEIGITMYPLEQ